MRTFPQRVLLVATLFACSPSEPASDAVTNRLPASGSAPEATQDADTSVALPREALALMGEWVPISPKRLSGDTLILREDQTASGLIPWEEDRDLRVSVWSVRYGSRDSVATRHDWRGGYSDGGDPECYVNKHDANCISMPILCIGVRQTRACGPFFVVASDTLLWANGMRLVRIDTPFETALRN